MVEMKKRYIVFNYVNHKDYYFTYAFSKKEANGYAYIPDKAEYGISLKTEDMRLPTIEELEELRNRMRNKRIDSTDWEAITFALLKEIEELSEW